MNCAQRRIWIGAVAGFLLSVIIPPWRVTYGTESFLRFQLLFSTPGITEAAIAYGILLLEWLALAVAAAVLHLTLRTASCAAPPPGAPPP